MAKCALPDADMLAEIERRASDADPMRGPDYRAIVTDVAEQAGVSYEHLRALWLDSFLMGAN